MTYRNFSKIAGLFFACFLSGMPLAAQSLEEIFSPFDATSEILVDHSAWGAILQKHLKTGPSGINLFDYKSVTGPEKESLGRYLNMLQNVDPATLKRDEQMAYWINFYNALTVKVILDHYPVESIKDISLPGSGNGPWKADLARVNGQTLSLDDIEHGILRPIWKDNRIHYAVNCASIGCPNLASTPYTAATLNTMLDKGARDYINSSRGVSVEGARMTLSSIYRWYSEDFQGGRTPVDHLVKYANPRKTREIKGALLRRTLYAYDWSLNEPR